MAMVSERCEIKLTAWSYTGLRQESTRGTKRERKKEAEFKIKRSEAGAGCSKK